MLTKVVNGKTVELSQKEEAEILSEWSSNDAKPEPEKAITVEALAAALIGKGVISSDDLKPK